MQHSNTEHFHLRDDGVFPNSPLPVIVYRKVLDLTSEADTSEKIKTLFNENNWKNEWENGIYDYHHYHSVTHEVLGVTDGETTVLLGGVSGVEILLEKGDVLIIPAGVAHKNITPGKKFRCIGAYPDGMKYDMNYGKTGERPAADENIKSVPLPTKDPVFGSSGDVLRLWEGK